MGQGALSKPVVQWWLSLHSSTAISTCTHLNINAAAPLYYK